MEGWILSWVSAPHGVRVQEEGLRCARSAQSTVDVFTTSTDRLVFFKNSPNVQWRKGNRVAAIIKESPSDTILFRAIFKGVAAPSPLQVDVQLRRVCQVIAGKQIMLNQSQFNISTTIVTKTEN